MPTKKSLLISPCEDQEEVSIYSTFDDCIIFESTHNEYPVCIQIKKEDWEEIKNFIDLEIKKMNENG
ncbi:MAG: hypothetical protein RI995_107 [Bacteroidota bacterium]|jgi:hypothetical protein